MNDALRSTVVLALAYDALAQSPATQPTSMPISGKLAEPIALFNGRDLAGWGWYSDPRTNVSDAWVVEGGMLRSTGRIEGYLRTEREHGPDYILTIEYRHVTEGDGALLFGVREPDRFPPRAMQVLAAFGNVGEIVNRGDYNWFVEMDRYRERDRMVKIGPASEKPLGEWNTVEILVDHGNLSVRVNDREQNNATGMDDVTGRIGLQSGSAVIEYRKIELTPIVKK